MFFCQRPGPERRVCGPGAEREEGKNLTHDINYLRLLAEKFPTIESVTNEIVNLRAIMHLPKGTEYYFSDLHGEHEAFIHLLRSGSGVIREKIDAQYALFRKSGPVGGEQKVRAAGVMPLVLDGYAEPEPEAQLEAYAREVGLLRDVEDRPCYTVMVSTLLSREGANRTTPSFAASIDRLAAKYLRSVSFFSGGKVVTVLLGNPSDFEEYLHILADELPQMARRALDGRCHMGISRMVRSLASLHGAYREAVEALRQGEHSGEGAQFVRDLAPAAQGGELLCQRALELLDQRYMDADLSLVSLSGMLDVSPNHLSACIKKYAGDTFINILIRRRMEAGRELVTGTELKLQEISRRCGYTDQHYFSYCFKKYCGESPNAMRRRLSAERAGEGA